MLYLVTWSTVWHILTGCLLLGLAGLSVFFPLWRWSGLAIAKRYGLATGFATQMILGYIFYVAGYIYYYPAVSLLLGLSIHSIVFWSADFRRTCWQTLKALRLNRWQIAIGLGLLLAVGQLWIDGLSTAAPGNIDTYTHVGFLKYLAEYGYINNVFYPPGLHILLYPLFVAIPTFEFYRFAGPLLGTITIVTIYTLIAPFFARNATRLVFIALLLLPVFNSLKLQLMSLFASELSFFLLLFLITIIADATLANRRLRWLLFCVGVVALSISVPYTYIHLLISLVVYSIIEWLRSRTGSTVSHNSMKALLGYICLAGLGLVLTFGHITLQNVLHQRTANFPQIRTVEVDDTGEVKQTTNRAKAEQHTEVLFSGNSAFAKFGNKVVEHPLAKKFVLPVWETSKDILRIKNIRQADNILGFGAYAWIVAALGMLAYAWRKTMPWWQMIAVFSVVYGYAVQTGSLEMSAYRGRAGWYLLLFCLIGTALLYEKIFVYVSERLHQFSVIKRAEFPLLLVAVVLAAVAGYMYNPTFYRAYTTDTFDYVASHREAFTPNSIILTSYTKVDMVVDAPVKTMRLREATDEILEQYSEVYFIYNKKYFRPDPVLSQQAYSVDKGYVSFNKSQDVLEQQYNEIITFIKNTETFKQASLVYETDTIAVYYFKR